MLSRLDGNPFAEKGRMSDFKNSRERGVAGASVRGPSAPTVRDWLANIRPSGRGANRLDATTSRNFVRTKS